MRRAQIRIEDLIILYDNTTDLLHRLEFKKKGGSKLIDSYIRKSKIEIDPLINYIKKQRIDHNYSEVVLLLLGWLRFQQIH